MGAEYFSIDFIIDRLVELKAQADKHNCGLLSYFIASAIEEAKHVRCELTDTSERLGLAFHSSVHGAQCRSNE